jgi:sugar lactone lactonase YvrE
MGIAVDTSGNLFFADFLTNRIRKVSTSGEVTTIAPNARALSGPRGVVVDATGNIFVAEYNAHRISRIAPDGSISVYAGGSSGDVDGAIANAQFEFPSALTMDASGNLYVAESAQSRNQKIRRITPQGVVSTVYDFGDASTGVFHLTVDSSGMLYGTGVGSLADAVVRIVPGGALTVIAGSAGSSGNVDGVSTTARFSGATGIAVDAAGTVYVADANNHKIRRITAQGVVDTIAGSSTPCCDFTPTDGIGSAARFDYPSAMTLGVNGELIVGDVYLLRKLTLNNFMVTTFVGDVLRRSTVDANGAAARFSGPTSIVLDAAGNAYVADQSRVRRVTPTGDVTTLAILRASHLAWDINGDLIVAGTNAVSRVTLAGQVSLIAGDPGLTDYVDAVGADARFYAIGGVAVDSSGTIYVSERQAGTIRKIATNGAVTTWVGVRDEVVALDGNISTARFASPNGMVFDAQSNLYVADAYAATIRRITSAGDVTTVAGTVNALGSADGAGSLARFRSPTSLAMDPTGNVLIGDLTNCTVRRMTPSGVVSTVLGVAGACGVTLGSSPRLNYINGIAARSANQLFISSEGAVLQATVP